MKELIWIGTSKNDLKEFPDAVQDEMGHALLVAQKGCKPVNAKVLKGFGSAKVLEIKENDKSGTYRTVYTVEKPEFIFVVHAFQKKSKSGIETAPQDMDKIKRRLKEVDALYNKLKN